MKTHRVTISFPWWFTATETRELLAFAFQVSVISYLGFYVIEDMNPGFVTGVLDLNRGLWVTVGLGALTAIWPTITSTRRIESLSWKNVIWMIGLGALTSGLLWFRLADQGAIRLPISILAGLIVVGLGLLVYFDHNENDRQDR